MTDRQVSPECVQLVRYTILTGSIAPECSSQHPEENHSRRKGKCHSTIEHRLDPSQVSDRRGRRVGTTVAVGGGGTGPFNLDRVIAAGCKSLGDLGDLTGQEQQAPATSGGDINNLQQECQTGADANSREDCRIVGFVNSIQGFWSDEFSRRGGNYVEAQTVLFTEATQSGCGNATSAVGPFYCPVDQEVYLDLDFFNELHSRFGAQGGPFAEAYVLAHEYGHHVQDLTGALNDSGWFGRRRAREQICYDGTPGGLSGRRLGIPRRRNWLFDAGH